MARLGAGAGNAAAAPFFFGAFWATDLWWSAALLIAAPAFQYLYIGPTFGLVHNLTTPRMRATASALVFLSVNLIGLGLGPMLVGVISDLIARAHEAAAYGVGGGCTSGTGAAIKQACRAASAHGLRFALAVLPVTLLWSALHYAAAGRTLRRDLKREDDPAAPAPLQRV